MYSNSIRFFFIFFTNSSYHKPQPNHPHTFPFLPSQPSPLHSHQSLLVLIALLINSTITVSRLEVLSHSITHDNGTLDHFYSCLSFAMQNMVAKASFFFFLGWRLMCSHGFLFQVPISLKFYLHSNQAFCIHLFCLLLHPQRLQLVTLVFKGARQRNSLCVVVNLPLLLAQNIRNLVYLINVV